MIHQTTIKTHPPKSIVWQGDLLVDWVSGGIKYHLDGTIDDSHRRFAYRFDTAKNSNDGQWTVIYERLGTKGILLKNGEFVRQINRSYYQAHVYEFPITFLELEDGSHAIVHCPKDYCQLDIQEAASGTFLTDKPDRKPEDNFFSRLESKGTYLLSAGWVWHPYEVLNVYNVSDVLENPDLLDTEGIGPNFSAEISSARFYGNKQVVIATIRTEEGEEENDSHDIIANRIAYYDLEERAISKEIRLDFPFGNAIAINDDYVLDLFEFPKVINMNTGKIEQQFEDIDSGSQNSPIISHLTHFPAIAIHPDQLKIAIVTPNGIEVLEWKN